MSVKRDQLAHLNDEFIKCRSRLYGHAWDDFIPVKGDWEWEYTPDIQQRCVRCGTEKYVWLDAEGNYACQPYYKYPEGYKLSGLYRGDRLTAAELRVEIVRRNHKAPKKRPGLGERPNLRAVG